MRNRFVTVHCWVFLLAASSLSGAMLKPADAVQDDGAGQGGGAGQDGGPDQNDGSGQDDNGGAGAKLQP